MFSRPDYDYVWNICHWTLIK